MRVFEFEGMSPVVDPAAWIAPTVTLIGDVRIEAGASVWFGAVLRGDLGAITVRAGANIQDNSVLHGGDVGPGSTVGHLCVVHDCVVGSRSIIGNGATVLDGARVGSDCMVAAHALVPPGMEIPDGQLAVGVPAELRGPLRGATRHWVDTNPGIYQELALRHRDHLREVTGPDVVPAHAADGTGAT